MKTHISNLLLSTFLFSSLWQNPVWPFGWTPLHMRRPVGNLLLCPLQLLTLPRLPMTPLSHPHRHLHLPTEKQVRSNLSASFNPISWVSLWDIADRMYTLGRLHINMCPFLFIYFGILFTWNTSFTRLIYRNVIIKCIYAFTLPDNHFSAFWSKLKNIYI